MFLCCFTCHRLQKDKKQTVCQGKTDRLTNQKGQMQINKQSDPNTFAWKTHVFVYNEAPLKKIIKKLEKV